MLCCTGFGGRILLSLILSPSLGGWMIGVGDEAFHVSSYDRSPFFVIVRGEREGFPVGDESSVVFITDSYRHDGRASADGKNCGTLPKRQERRSCGVPSAFREDDDYIAIHERLQWFFKITLQSPPPLYGKDTTEFVKQRDEAD